ncbi:HAD-like protein [Vararia minispora EC-137]|uniref:HAD-like protein n=1 Tax=Vararia minispora EC-137 TaxID=1314806 RepID=A0ACB8QBH9_9AGAM|nr:HAD-like protein [Vararia minispora EC-137]
MPIRLVTFDALYTLLEPRAPVAVQYADLFRPYLGSLDPAAIRAAFKPAFKRAQITAPNAPEHFWTAVLRETALAAGADPAALAASLPALVPAALHRFSSREGYTLYDDTLPALEKLRGMGVMTGLVSNADARILDALADLGAAHLLNPILLGERDGPPKPAMALFHRAAVRAGVEHFGEVLHVGDEFENDYNAAWNASVPAVLLRRPGADAAAHREDEAPDAQLAETVASLDEVVTHVELANKPPRPPRRQRRWE